jgi:hypothetical protein
MVARDQWMRIWGTTALLCLAVSLTACGGGETTTVIREAPAPPAETIEQTTTVEAPPPKTADDDPQSIPNEEPPNVLGLPLPEARRMLKQAGYETATKNTDTTLGIIVPDNYTICRQGKPRGNLVVVLAQKYGC